VLTHQEKLGDQSIATNISIGISSTALFPAVSPDEMIKLAEKALRNARAEHLGIVQAAPENSEVIN
jgi:PleD family two-component response regulator